MDSWVPPCWHLDSWHPIVGHVRHRELPAQIPRISRGEIPLAKESESMYEAKRMRAGQMQTQIFLIVLCLKLLRVGLSHQSMSYV